jgi:hypothetical protein
MISNRQLQRAFVSPPLQHYFRRKLAPLADDEVDARIEETLKFLNMAGHIEGSIPVTRELDEVWHYWILETQEYATLCARLPGGGFVHHASNDFAEFADPEIGRRAIDIDHHVAILASYVDNYGPFAAERVRYWRVAVRLMEARGWDVARLNRWLGAPVPVPVSQPER